PGRPQRAGQILEAGTRHQPPGKRSRAGYEGLRHPGGAIEDRDPEPLLGYIEREGRTHGPEPDQPDLRIHSMPPQSDFSQHSTPRAGPDAAAGPYPPASPASISATVSGIP